MFDHNSPEHAGSAFETYRALRQSCPAAYTTSHGGYWVLSRYDDVCRAARDAATFSSARGGVIPATSVGRLLPIQADPPALERYRSLLNRYLTPKASMAFEPFIRECTDAAIDRFIERGCADLVAELASPIPAMVTMRLLGLDPNGWAVFGEPLHQIMYAVPGSPEHALGEQRVAAFSRTIIDEIDARAEAPRDDMISQLLVSEYAGIKTTKDEVVDLVRMVIFGGLDTVVAALGNIFLQLDRRPDIRARLIAERRLLPAAIEEFLRFEPPIHGFARHVTTGVRIGEQPIAAGETVFLAWASANRDETLFGETADQLVIDRRPNHHVTFGAGGHRCQGSALARIELLAVLDRVLERIPGYAVAWERVVPPLTIGSIYGQISVPVTFPPGPKTGS